ncbi:MAG: siphovirus ReqiPepy6 Gp37-like family protein, partial [archaeon]
MYPLYIFDSTLTLLGMIDNYEYLKWNFKYRTVDDFEIKVNRYKNNASYLIAGNIVSVYINNEYRAGIIELKELTLTQDGKLSESYHIIGRGLDGLLAERIALYVTASGTGYDSQNDKAETIMRHFVDVNCISSGTAARNYSLLELETDLTRGATVKYDARFQILSELLEDISLASGLGWGVVLDTINKKMNFRIYEGLDRSFGNGVNSVVCFNPEYGNVKLLGYRESRLNSKNVTYLGGQDVAELRTVTEVTKDAGSYSDTLRRETFIDARDLDAVDKLTQRGNERLVELGEESVIEMENLSTGPFEFGTDFDVGDIVTVKYPSVIEADARIIESQLEITPENGLANKLIIGRS